MLLDDGDIESASDAGQFAEHGFLRLIKLGLRRGERRVSKRSDCGSLADCVCNTSNPE
jgi:hypothetical protein